MIRWSHSRDKDVRTCERRVFLKQRYASSRADRDSARFRAYLLKKAIDAPAWAGRITHEVIKSRIVPVLKEAKQPNFREAKEYAIDLLARQEAFSRERRFLDTSQTAAGVDFCVLRPHVTAIEDTVEFASKAAQLAFNALEILETRHTAVLEELRSPGELIAEKEIRFTIADVMVEAIPDILFINRSGRVLILDWKVWMGSSSSTEQLQVYAYAVLKSGWWRGLTPERMRLCEANLVTGSFLEASVTQDQIAQVDERIFSGSEKLANIYNTDESIDEIDPLIFTPASRPGACRTCPVLEICNGTYATERQTELPFELFSA